jgi:hypothetical protein
MNNGKGRIETWQQRKRVVRKRAARKRSSRSSKPHKQGDAQASPLIFSKSRANARDRYLRIGTQGHNLSRMAGRDAFRILVERSVQTFDAHKLTRLAEWPDGLQFLVLAGIPRIRSGSSSTTPPQAISSSPLRQTASVVQCPRRPGFLRAARLCSGAWSLPPSWRRHCVRGGPRSHKSG